MVVTDCSIDFCALRNPDRSNPSPPAAARADAIPPMDGPGRDEEEDSFPIGGDVDIDIDIDEGEDEDDVDEEEVTIDLPELHRSAPSAPTSHPARSAATIRYVG
jgi:hypothetical protein